MMMMMMQGFNYTETQYKNTPSQKQTNKQKKVKHIHSIITRQCFMYV